MFDQTGITRVRVAADVAAAGVSTLLQVVALRCANSFSWRLSDRADAALALRAVAARAVGLVQVVAALDRGDLLGVGLGVEPRLR